MLLANFIGYFLSITSHLCSVCRNDNPVPSSFMSYHRVCSKSLQCLVDHCLIFYLVSFWPLCCLSFNLRILITPLVSSIFFYALYISIDCNYCQIVALASPGIVFEYHILYQYQMNMFQLFAHRMRIACCCLHETNRKIKCFIFT